jgi:hypothetical protein
MFYTSIDNGPPPSSKIKLFLSPHHPNITQAVISTISQKLPYPRKHLLVHPAYHNVLGLATPLKRP